MTTAITLYRCAVDRVVFAGTPAVAMNGPLQGGIIVNPQFAADQGLDTVEVLYVDLTGPAALQETETTVPIQPGGVFYVIPGQTTNVWVNAVSAGHKFSGYVIQAPTPYPPTPQPGTFPPSGPTTMTDIIPSYLYKEYDDDDDLQAFVGAYNVLAQSYMDFFVSGLLPVYTSSTITGALLDWVAAGLYGMTRPALSSGRNRDLGPLNTYAYNVLPLNKRRRVGPTDVTVTSDDIFKRIMTWNFYKGDGNAFNVRWLKRRLMRFLIGTDGSAPNVDQTYPISVTFGNGAIAIRINVGTRRVTGGALYNRFGFNRMPYNALRTTFVPASNPLPYESVLKEALDAGVLQLPFQYTYSIAIGG